MRVTYCCAASWKLGFGFSFLLACIEFFAFRLFIAVVAQHLHEFEVAVMDDAAAQFFQRRIAVFVERPGPQRPRKILRLPRRLENRRAVFHAGLALKGGFEQIPCLRDDGQQ